MLSSFFSLFPNRLSLNNRLLNESPFLCNKIFPSSVICRSSLRRWSVVRTQTKSVMKKDSGPFDCVIQTVDLRQVFTINGHHNHGDPGLCRFCLLPHRCSYASNLFYSSPFVTKRTTLSCGGPPHQSKVVLVLSWLNKDRSQLELWKSIWEWGNEKKDSRLGMNPLFRKFQEVCHPDFTSTRFGVPPSIFYDVHHDGSL